MQQIQNMLDTRRLKYFLSQIGVGVNDSINNNILKSTWLTYPLINCGRNPRDRCFKMCISFTSNHSIKLLWLALQIKPLSVNKMQLLSAYNFTLVWLLCLFDGVIVLTFRIKQNPFGHLVVEHGKNVNESHESDESRFSFSQVVMAVNIIVQTVLKVSVWYAINDPRTQVWTIWLRCHFFHWCSQISRIVFYGSTARCREIVQ